MAIQRPKQDLLVMPTLPLKATLIPAPDAPFDVTGHPAMNVPCAMSDGLPVGDDARRQARR